MALRPRIGMTLRPVSTLRSVVLSLAFATACVSVSVSVSVNIGIGIGALVVGLYGRMVHWHFGIVRLIGWWRIGGIHRGRSIVRVRSVDLLLSILE